MILREIRRSLNEAGLTSVGKDTFAGLGNLTSLYDVMFFLVLFSNNNNSNNKKKIKDLQALMTMIALEQENGREQPEDA